MARALAASAAQPYRSLIQDKSPPNMFMHWSRPNVEDGVPLDCSSEVNMTKTPRVESFSCENLSQACLQLHNEDLTSKAGQLHAIQGPRNKSCHPCGIIRRYSKSISNRAIRLRLFRKPSDSGSVSMNLHMLWEEHRNDISIYVLRDKSSYVEVL